jgi:chromosome segregation ATPase
LILFNNRNYEAIIREKDNILNKFDLLVDQSNNKFKEYEETNTRFNTENEKLKLILHQFNSTSLEFKLSEKNYIEEIENLKSEIASKNNEISLLKVKAESTEEKNQKKFEDLEEKLKEKFIVKEAKRQQGPLEEISKLKSENQTLKINLEQSKYDNKTAEGKLFDLFNYCEEKKIENEKMIKNKNQEYDNLLNKIKSLKREMEIFEKLSEEKSKEVIIEKEMLQEEIVKLNQILNSKDQEINNKNFEKQKIFEILEERRRDIIDVELGLKNKEEFITKLKAEINNLNNNLIIFESKSKANEKSHERFNEQMEEKKKNLEKEREILEGEKKKLVDENDKFFKKIEVMAKYIKGIKKKFEMEGNKIIGISQQKLILAINDRYDNHIREIQSLENIIREKQKQIDKIKLKYQNKKYKVIIFI